MTPQERQLIDDLFDRLARLESAPRDPQAAAAISQGLQQAPNAVYALVQTVLVQDEALKRANARIEELQHAQAPQQAQSGGFLDSMRDSIFGSGSSRGSVPNVPPPSPSRPVWNSGQALPQGQPGYPAQPGPYDQGGFGQPRGGMFGGGGGSFLGTAAAAAAGMVGGSLLLGGIRSMMGGGQHQAFGDTTIIEERGGGASPWSDQSGGSLARDAGLDDIGRSGDGGGRAGLFDQASYDDSGNDSDAADFDADDNFGGDDGGSEDV
ncbi:ABC transporter substrate-binding protein [Bradyrhizobium sp. SSBR45G]|uniref:DUF2076 domain-containing protein n=1 Tax=unclassified Bradyrhizobium TaxID=2631580 RepID=UPI0023429C0D|nr:MULTISPECIES: DUF2076 domain-containing protein [unclassified Bradyrhizobium]GLH80973.1 ABC transporter substrate-binding protein [Bradyrhizobium sp. SSBR45G]GLH88445.1 ABC transporter substrate-binding protein [Bradyrhizobium sp. SSBR45R]